MRLSKPAPKFLLSCCRATDFVALSPSFSPTEHGKGEQTGGLYMCCHCGQVHGMSAAGPYDPHPDTLPPHLAMMYAQRSAAERARVNGPGVREMRKHNPPPAMRKRPVEPE